MSRTSDASRFRSDDPLLLGEQLGAEERMVRDSARGYTYEGTHDVHALILGRAQTGIPAFA